MAEHTVQIKELVSDVLDNERQLCEEDVMTLFSARGADFDVVCEAAGTHLQCLFEATAGSITEMHHHYSLPQPGLVSI